MRILHPMATVVASFQAVDVPLMLVRWRDEVR